jgi:hypothetical protein
VHPVWIMKWHNDIVFYSAIKWLEGWLSCSDNLTLYFNLMEKIKCVS